MKTLISFFLVLGLFLSCSRRYEIKLNTDTIYSDKLIDFYNVQENMVFIDSISNNKEINNILKEKTTETRSIILDSLLEIKLIGLTDCNLQKNDNPVLVAKLINEGFELINVSIVGRGQLNKNVSFSLVQVESMNSHNISCDFQTLFLFVSNNNCLSAIVKLRKNHPNSNFHFLNSNLIDTMTFLSITNQLIPIDNKKSLIYHPDYSVFRITNNGHVEVLKEKEAMDILHKGENTQFLSESELIKIQ